VCVEPVSKISFSHTPTTMVSHSSQCETAKCSAESVVLFGSHSLAAENDHIGFQDGRECGAYSAATRIGSHSLVASSWKPM
jgi:hypothetical protein